jgi:3-keto-5-aminohexanoate cleavage enzyme
MTAETPAMISCALIGGAPSTNPHHPVNAADIVREGIAAARAGAAVLHIHARTEHGLPSQRPDVYRSIGEAIRAEVDVILNYTTGGSPGMSDDERLGSVHAGPELASLDAGTMNFGGDDDFVFVNTPRFQKRAAQQMLELGVKPEIECFDAGMVMAGLELIEAGLVARPPLFQLVLGVRGGAPARMETLVHLVGLLPDDAVWAAFAVGRPHFQIMAGVLGLGGHLRTGMEDVAYVAAGERATSNAALVERAVAMCQTVGRAVASPAQARELLAGRLLSQAA